MAREFVKVLISGEGGDEAFAGYPNYRNMLWMERLKALAGPVGGALSSGLAGFNRVTGSKRLGKYVPLLKLPFEDYYYSRISGPSTFFNTNSGSLYSRDFAHFVNKDFSLRSVRQHARQRVGGRFVNRMLYVDTKTSLPDDLLLKADKMTMANSIELRVPLLDHKVLEFAAGLPENFKVRGFTTKYIAKKSLRNLIPSEILERKKVGFPVPFGAWIKTELKDYVHDVLFDRQTLDRGYFNRASVEGLIRDHGQSGEFPKEILSLVSLELWHRAFLGATGDVSPELLPAGAAELP
jgi:asparagine synthase (glutamine-hydrolysing)